MEMCHATFSLREEKQLFCLFEVLLSQRAVDLELAVDYSLKCRSAGRAGDTPEALAVLHSGEFLPLISCFVSYMDDHTNMLTVPNKIAFKCLHFVHIS